MCVCQVDANVSSLPVRVLLTTSQLLVSSDSCPQSHPGGPGKVPQSRHRCVLSVLATAFHKRASTVCVVAENAKSWQDQIWYIRLDYRDNCMIRRHHLLLDVGRTFLLLGEHRKLIEVWEVRIPFFLNGWKSSSTIITHLSNQTNWRTIDHSTSVSFCISVLVWTFAGNSLERWHQHLLAHLKTIDESHYLDMFF